MGLTSAKGTYVHAGEEVTVSSGLDTNIAVGRSLLASVAEKVSLFSANAGIKLFAAKGKVQVQARAMTLTSLQRRSGICCLPRLASR
jgi:type VI secretion system secreted protein VgrG